MAEDRIAKSIGIDELVQSITAATLRGIKSEQPALNLEKAGLFVHFKVYCGIPTIDKRLLNELESE